MKYTFLIAGISLFSFSVRATSLSVDFTASGGVQSGSGFSNVRTYTSGGVTVTVTAWGLTGNGSTTFQNANVGQYSGVGLGLGVCDQLETLNCSSPNHQVDNATAYDFVLFQFSSTVTPLTVTIKPYGTWDRDVTYYTGIAASGLNLNGVTLAALNGLGLTNLQNDDSSIGSTQRIVNLVSGGANSILFGARVGGDSSPDYFKIGGLAASTSTAPEPATLAFTGAALVGLAALSRRVNRR